MDFQIIESIKKMRPNGCRLELPTDEQLGNYPQLKKCLLNAGGKYKRCGFEFKEDAKEIQSRLIDGEAINDQKKYQFFATPTGLARRMVEIADIKEIDMVLEPSAGQGAISDLVINIGAECWVIEKMPENINALKRKGYKNILQDDFLRVTPEFLGTFNKILANPPFTRNQDIDHIKHMYSFLKSGGRLVTLSSKSWTFGQQKKQIAFRKWLSEINADIEEIDKGTFKSSGTMVGAMLINIKKKCQVVIDP